MCIPLGPIMTDPNVRDLLVPKALSSPNMWNHMIGPPWLMIKKIFWCIPQTLHSPTTIWRLSVISDIMSLHMNIFLSKLILFICSTQMSMIILFLSNSDLKYSYVFPLMTSVVLRISYKECYWAYCSYKDLSLRWVIIQ
jgi:hypothetical protein